MTLTTRLVLEPIDFAPVTIDAIFALQSDPETWTHLPDGVETDVSQSRTMAEDHARSWRGFGLGWWLVRLRAPLPGVSSDEIVGVGGAARRHPEIAAWNLGYRLSPRVWGHGFAAEISRAALASTQSTDPTVPVTARALTRNPASWHTLERAGLSLRWEGTDPADSALASGLQRRVYADRELDPALLNQLIALG